MIDSQPSQGYGVKPYRNRFGITKNISGVIPTAIGSVKIAGTVLIE